jgi:porphobilinogen synthase
VAEECVALGIPVLALFPAIDPALKTPDGIEATNPDGLIPRVVRELKKRVPELGVLCDVALDPYTSHGQDGVIDENGYVLNEPTVEILVKQALTQAEAGVDMVAPSDMMDGRVAAIRGALDRGGKSSVGIISYAAKLASAFYGPFRDAAGSAPSFGDRKGYQLPPSNPREILRDALLDEDEGADMLIVKPAGPCLDIAARLRGRTELPMVGYMVSGEYAMLRAAISSGALDERSSMIEYHTAIRRAGCDLIITYFATELARLVG